MSLKCQHFLETWEVKQAVRAVRFETCPQLQTLNVMVVFALRVFFDSIALFEVCEAYRASHYAEVDHVVLVGDHTHSGEHGWLDALLQEIDAILSQCSHSLLVSRDIILNVDESIFVNLLVGFTHLTSVQLSQELKHRLLDLGGLLSGGETEQKQAHVAEHEHIGEDEPEDDEGEGVVVVSLAVCTSLVDLDEDVVSINSP